MATTAILRHRRDTAANWTATNPVMEAGQIGIETDTRRIKFGDGATAWTSLVYANAHSGVTSPAQLTANTDNWNALDTYLTIRASTDASRNLTGLTGGSSGRLAIIHNVGSFNLVLKDESASSTAANRFALTADITMTPDTCVWLQYDSTTSRWRSLGVGGSAGTGDVVGPAGATDNAVARYDSTTGKLLQDCVVLISDTGDITGAKSIAIPLDGMKLGDTDASHYLILNVGSNLTANRILTITTGDNARTFDISAANVTVSAFGATLVDDADAAAARTTLGLGSIATQAANSVSITGGSITGITDLAVADGGTGASTAAGARTNLGLGTMAELAATARQLSVCFHAAANTTSASMGAHPSTVQFLCNNSRSMTQVDLTHYTQCRIAARVTTGSASPNTPRIRVRYHTAFSTTIGDFVDAGTSEIAASVTSTGMVTSSWIDLASGAKADIFLIIDQIGGDSLATPALGILQVYFR